MRKFDSFYAKVRRKRRVFHRFLNSEHILVSRADVTLATSALFIFKANHNCRIPKPNEPDPYYVKLIRRWCATVQGYAHNFNDKKARSTGSFYVLINETRVRALGNHVMLRTKIMITSAADYCKFSPQSRQLYIERKICTQSDSVFVLKTRFYHSCIMQYIYVDALWRSSSGQYIAATVFLHVYFWSATSTAARKTITVISLEIKRMLIVVIVFQTRHTFKTDVIGMVFC